MANDLLSLSSVDTPWFVHVAAEPLLQLLKANPHLNVSELASTPAPNPFRFDRNQLQKRDSCYRSGTTGTTGGSDSNTSSGPSGALIGGIVGGVVGVILLIVLAWFLWRRKRNQRLQNQQQQQNINPNNNTTMGFPPGAMPTPYDPGQGVTPPMMKQTGPGGFAMMNNGSGTGPNFTSASFPGPPSSAGWSGTGSGTNSTAPLTSNPIGGNSQERQSYYNYAPPPPENSMAGFMPTAANNNNGGQWNSSTNLTAAGGPLYSGTPSPPPPSSTPGATSSYSGGTGYAPWAIPHSSSPGPSVSGIASGSSSPAPPPHGPPGGMFFPTAAEEKAHYSRRNGKEEEARSGMTAPTPAPPAYEPYRGQQ